MLGIIGRKVGMTQVFDENGNAVPVTVIQAGPCFVTQVRSGEKDGYTAIQLGFSEAKPQRIFWKSLNNGQMQFRRTIAVATRWPT